MTEKTVRFGVIGCGLMAREFASATQRWAHLPNMDVRPRLVAVADAKDSCLCWFTDNLCDVTAAVTDYRELLANPEVDAVYCAVPHNLHAQIYCDIIRAGKHLFGEKPFGIDLAANRQILAALREHPEVFARCSSEFPFFPGAYQIVKFIREGRFGKIIEVEAASGTPATSTRTSRSTGSAWCSSTASTAAWATWGCTCCTSRCASAGCRTTCAACCRRSSPSGRTARAAWRRARRGTTPSWPARCRPPTSTSRCCSAPSASRPARPTPGSSRSTARSSRPSSPPSTPRRCGR